MINFEVGKTYTAGLNTGYVSPVQITRRTEKSIWYRFRNDKERRAKIQNFCSDYESATLESTWYVTADNLWDKKAEGRRANWYD